MDCHLLKEVYINLLDQKEPKLNLQNAEIFTSEFNSDRKKNNQSLGKIIRPTNEELKLHKEYLKNDLTKNFFN